MRIYLVRHGETDLNRRGRRVYRPVKGARRERTLAGRGLCDIRAAAAAYAGFTYIGKSNIG